MRSPEHLGRAYFITTINFFAEGLIIHPVFLVPFPNLLLPARDPSPAMATATRRLLPGLLRTLAPAGARGLTTEKAVGAAAVVGSHTAKWMQDTSKKSPMELINEVPPIKVDGRIAVCEGASVPALGHPIEYICLDLEEPNVCKYCGLRYVQVHHH